MDDTAARSLILWLAVIALLAPLVSSALIIVLTRRVMFLAAGWFATLVMAGAFACSVVALLSWMGLADKSLPIVANVPWIPVPSTAAGWLYLGILYDSLTGAMLVMVTGVSMLVHLYSIGYMDGDKRFNLFFAYLSLFSFSMLGIVTANSLIMLFVFWELVGLTSYLLIGFWFERRGPQLACKKAFVMNRIGDAGFLVGFGILFYQLGGNVLLPAATGDAAAESLNMFERMKEVIEASGHSLSDPPMWLTVAGIGLFCGAIGKSAQFPLHTWLPDAMEGPTPVSSIVHSATMVAAGVYLTGRIYPILTPEAHVFVATIGLITLVMAACMALVMTDIKRVLAYSTLSQLGYMILGLGVGAWAFALFHLITHAFFKCCLFQCSGSVINSMHHEQDMRHYGGLARKMPFTALCFFVCTLAIAGASIGSAVGLSGYYSKDGIIQGAFNYGHAMTWMGSWSALFWIGPVVIAYVTPFYMARAFTLTFLGKPRDEHRHEHAHEAPWTMVVPQLALAFMAVVSGWFLWKGLILGSEPNAAPVIIQTAEAIEANHGMEQTHAALLHGFAWIIAIGAGVLLYLPGFAISSRIAAIPGINILCAWTRNKFYFDALYDVFAVGLTKIIAYLARAFDTYIVDGLVNLTAAVFRWAGFRTGEFDNNIVDGAFNGAATLAHNSGQMLRGAHTGRIRGYVLLLFSAAVIVMLLVVTASQYIGRS